MRPNLFSVLIITFKNIVAATSTENFNSGACLSQLNRSAECCLYVTGNQFGKARQQPTGERKGLELG